MRIEIGENLGWTLFGLALIVMAIVFVGYGTKAGIHEREQVIKADTCEKVAAISGNFQSSDILMCQRKD